MADRDPLEILWKDCRRLTEQFECDRFAIAKNLICRLQKQIDRQDEEIARLSKLVGELCGEEG